MLCRLGLLVVTLCNSLHQCCIRDCGAIKLITTNASLIESVIPKYAMICDRKKQSEIEKYRLISHALRYSLEVSHPIEAVKAVTTAPMAGPAAQNECVLAPASSNRGRTTGATQR